MALTGQHRQDFDQHEVVSRKGGSVLAKILSLALTWRYAPAFRQPHPDNSFWQSPQPQQLVGDASLAQLMYRGIFEFAGEKISTTPDQLFRPGTGGRQWTIGLFSLDWLFHFAAQPTKLGACYATTLLQAWNNTVLKSQQVEQESARLLTMQACLPELARFVEAPMRQILMQSLHLQCERLKLAKPGNMQDGAHQHLTLARNALALLHPGDDLADSLKRLDAALAKSIHADGGPVAAGVAEHQRLWNDLSHLEKVLQQRDMSLSPPVAQVRDRIAGFLAMFQRSDGSLAFNLQHDGQDAIPQPETCEIQKLAARSGIARLSHGRSVLIASNGVGFAAPCIDISIGKSPLLSFGAFQAPSHAAEIRTIEDTQGSVLELGNRQIFMAASGNDIRIQDELQADPDPTPLVLKFDPGIRISLARHSGRVSLALPDRTHWQLCLRGGYFAPCNNDHELLIVPEPGIGKTLNWAIKRIVEDRTCRSVRSAKHAVPPPELLL